MKRAVALAIPLLLLLSIGTAGSAQAVEAASDSVRAGSYESAIGMLQRVGTPDLHWMAAQRLLARTLMTVGRYDDAEAVARRATAAPGGQSLLTTLGEALYARGRSVDADAAFTHAIAAHAPDSLTAALDLAVLHYDRGQRTRALHEFDRFIDVYNTHAATLTADELLAVGTACRYLGARDPQLFKDALKAFDQAASRDAGALEPKIRVGELFLEKYNGADAQAQLEEVLRVNGREPRALLAAARRAYVDDEPGADSLSRLAIAVNPNFTEAHVFRAGLLIDLENYAGALRELDRALAVDPASGSALAAVAATRYLQDDARGFADAKRRSLAVDSSGVELYDVVAEAAERVRRYRDAADLATQAVAQDAKDWQGWSILGMNQLRLGDIAGGRRSLETAFSGDPYNVRVKNTLDLLDTFKGYAEVRTDHFLFVVDTSEADLLVPYLRELGEAAYATFAKRYGYTPAPPIRVEVYRSHADFSVRTVGLAGLGALGVSFGTTLAFDSPAAKDAGPFNWGSTVWHELAHTFTLGVSDHRVPRWLSEGLSVFEEHHARSGWGFGVTPGFLQAFLDGRLAPPSRLNDGFMHPQYPQQVQYSYYEASLVCDLIARQWGDSIFRRMLLAYKSGLGTDEVFQRVLGETPGAFDRRFDAYLRDRFAVALRGLPDFPGEMAAGKAALAAGRTDDAIAHVEAAKRLFPEYGGDDSPYRLLATIHKTRGEIRQAADELAALVARDETNYAAAVERASFLEQLGDNVAAAAALNLALYVDPYEVPVHANLAELAERTGDKATVVRERQAIVALAPTDRAEALYRLAVAYRDAGDRADARHTVLRALEEAPNYADAQALLLALHGTPPDTSKDHR